MLKTNYLTFDKFCHQGSQNKVKVIKLKDCTLVYKKQYVFGVIQCGGNRLTKYLLAGMDSHLAGMNFHAYQI